MNRSTRHLLIAALSLALAALSGCAAGVLAPGAAGSTSGGAHCVVSPLAIATARQVRATCSGSATVDCYQRLGERAAGEPLAR
ncbi:MAG: hypothetical protein EXR72_15575 [Myxococcales bacterium]|nr:hypothetical protein [Myxococcales bacterium]